MSFELHRAHIAERLVQPLPIIEHFDELEHLCAGLLPRVVVIPVMDQLVFERAEEALDDRVVVAVALAAHADHETLLGQQLLIGAAGVERALIAVMDEAGGGLSLGQRHLEGRDRHLLVGGGTHGPADDAAGVQIEQHGQVQPARASGNGREVPGPDAIGRRGREDLPDMVGGRRGEVMMLHHHVEPPDALGDQAMHPAQTGHPMPPTGHTLSDQRPSELHRAVALLGLSMELPHLGHQLRIGLRPPAHRALAPGVGAAATDAQDGREPNQPVEGRWVSMNRSLTGTPAQRTPRLF